MAYRPQPGPQQPGKYQSKVGPKYNKYGEQESLGYYYDPLTDSYSRDPNIAKNNAKKLHDQNNPPGQPGLMETIGPVAGTAAAIGVGQSIAKDGGAGLLSGLKETVGSLGDMFGTAKKTIQSGADFVSDSFGFGGADAGLQATQQSMSNVAPQAFGPGGAPDALLPGGSDLTNTLGGADDALAGGAPPSALSQGLGAAGAAYGAYNALQGVKKGDPLQAGLGGAGAVAGINAMGYALGPWGVAATIAAPAALAFLNDQFFSHKDTKQYQKERTDQLLEKGFTEEQLRVLRPTTFDDMPKADDGEWKRLMKIPGNKERFENGVTSNWGSDGMLKTFGPEYLNEMSEQDRWALTRAAIDNKFLKSDKGDRVIAGPNKEKLRAMADEAKSNPAYIEEYQRWVAAGKPPNGLDPLITEEGTDPAAGAPTPGSAPPSTNAGLLVSGPTNVDISSGGAKGAAAAAPAVNAGLLVGARPVGFDPDPNNPGKFIRRK